MARYLTTAKKVLKPFLLWQDIDELVGSFSIIALKLIARVEAVSVSSVMDEFPALFQGLGNLGEPFDICLQPS